MGYDMEFLTTGSTNKRPKPQQRANRGKDKTSSKNPNVNKASVKMFRKCI